MKKKVTVLGNGLVGAVMALDLASDEKYEVTVCDADKARLQKTKDDSGGRISAKDDVDFSSPDSIASAVKGQDLVIGAVPGSLGYAMLGAVIRAGVSMSDISFMAEDYREWDAEAKKRGVTTFEDAGVAPGSSSILIGYACDMLDVVEDVTYYVTGLPTAPEAPFNYKLVFSPDDLIEEYVRPARTKRNGEVITVPALSGRKAINFDIPGVKLPEMEGFFTDGSRTLLDTIPSPNVTEYTLRYPGTADRMEFLREIGIFDTEPVDVKGAKVRPRDLFGAIAYPKMRLGQGENEFTFYHVEVTGKKDGKRLQYRYSLYDERDMKTGYPSMSRTTGFTCVIVGRLIADGVLKMPGVNPPESIGKNHKAVEIFLEELKKRNVRILDKIEEL
ncbi:MAG: saccharopine dehydrogenase NADP-binding domain-containing protein [Synergistaceae bacterium]|jgi:saccharopine dehydrogenase-like NADP-dependent oxidoreductase|nr:saccharopine dehydrogenase NADP-binding domain-containing protein [Synergistaceae bacterium]